MRALHHFALRLMLYMLLPWGPQVHVHAAQDESACIGCKQCVWCASGVFRMEPEYGRSRVFAQWCDTEDNIQVGTPFETTLLP